MFQFNIRGLIVYISDHLTTEFVNLEFGLKCNMAEVTT